MKNFTAKYILVVGVIMFIFTQFVACGAQMYQVGLEEDTIVTYVADGSTDPNSPNYGLHAPNGWKRLPVKFKVGTKLAPDQKAGLVKAMRTWEMAVGKKLFTFEGVHNQTDGDTFDDLYSSLDDSVNGHYLDNYWDKTGKPTYVLATTIWDNAASDVLSIETADIRFNGDYYVIGDSVTAEADNEKQVVDMETLALHELGHLLGLAHIDSGIDFESIMTPSLYIGEGLHNRIISKGDMMRVQRIYGCEGMACNLEATSELLSKQAGAGTSSETAH